MKYQLMFGCLFLFSYGCGKSDRSASSANSTLPANELSNALVAPFKTISFNFLPQTKGDWIRSYFNLKMQKIIAEGINKRVSDDDYNASTNSIFEKNYQDPITKIHGKIFTMPNTLPVETPNALIIDVEKYSKIKIDYESPRIDFYEPSGSHSGIWYSTFGQPFKQFQSGTFINTTFIQIHYKYYIKKSELTEYGQKLTRVNDINPEYLVGIIKFSMMIPNYVIEDGQKNTNGNRDGINDLRDVPGFKNGFGTKCTLNLNPSKVILVPLYGSITQDKIECRIQ